MDMTRYLVDAELTPNVENVRSGYDRSNEFFRLWLDPTMTYSCAYFEHADMTLEEAQLAKIDLALRKLGLKPGMTLLDIGCGWGSAMRRAIQRYDVNVIGLTLSEHQVGHCQKMFDQLDSPRSKQVRLQGWEQFDQPVDRIVSLGAFEHFADGVGTYERYDDFFKMCHPVLPDDGVMLLHSIVVPSADEVAQLRLNTTMPLLRFMRFIVTEIFPGGRLPVIPIVDGYASRAGFDIIRHHRIGSNYVRTLESWAKALEAHKDEAVSLQSEEVYQRHMKFLTG